MANPTTNYGFVLPTPTDLVTDLPADFDVALQGVDTRLKALNPATTLGDLTYASATANTNTRLGIGTTGQVLKVAGGVPTWGNAGGALNLTLLASGTMSGSPLSFTGLTQDTFVIKWTGGNGSVNGQDMKIYFNSDQSNSYYQLFLDQGPSLNEIWGAAGPYIYSPNRSNKRGVMTITNGKSTAAKQVEYTMGSSSTQYENGVAVYYGTSAITSIQLGLTSGSWSSGSYELWGA